MADKFAKWDVFQRHMAYTNDPHQALRWTRYELWAHKRRIKHLKELADMAATRSALAFSGVVLPKTT